MPSAHSRSGGRGVSPASTRQAASTQFCGRIAFTKAARPGGRSRRVSSTSTSGEGPQAARPAAPSASAAYIATQATVAWSRPRGRQDEPSSMNAVHSLSSTRAGFSRALRAAAGWGSNQSARALTSPASTRLCSVLIGPAYRKRGRGPSHHAPRRCEVPRRGAPKIAEELLNRRRLMVSEREC
jgi:hypothetical protein